MTTFELFFRDGTITDLIDRIAVNAASVAPGLGRERARDIAELVFRPMVGQTKACGRFAECWSVQGSVWGQKSPPMDGVRPCFLECDDPFELPVRFAEIAADALEYTGDQRDALEERMAGAMRHSIAPLLFRNIHCGKSRVCAAPASSPFRSEPELPTHQTLGGNSIMSVIRVREVMTSDVLAVGPDTSLDTAARLLTTRHITGAPVVDDKGRALGVVTMSDLCDPDRDRSGDVGKSLFYRIGNEEIEIIGDGVEVEGRVADIMSPYVLSVGPETVLSDAIRLMVVDEVHRLLVVEDGQLVGIVTTMDILQAIAKWLDSNRIQPSV